MVAWLKALLFVVGGVTAAAGTAYVAGLLDPWIGRGPTVIASLPEGGEVDAGTEDGAVEDEPAPGGPIADQPATPDDPATTEKQGRLVAPSFDLVRVEPDGSLLVAGKAAAGATIEVLTGDTVLGSATVGDAGDFVVVLDNPLEPGDYQIALRATSDGTAAMSMQTALVSVPETPDGEVLALVEEPGAPSRLITVPEGETADEQDAPDDGGTGEEEQVAAANEPATEDRPAGTNNDAAAQPHTGGDSAAQSGDDAAGADVPVSADEDDAAGSAPDEEQELAAAASDDAAEQGGAASADASAGTPGVSSETLEMTAADESAAGEPAAEDQPSKQEIAALPSEEPADATGEQPAQTPRVVVEAVEIEGDTVFVAGYADPGSTVRVYANEVHLGDARASEGGRFLVEARRELAVGDYVIRADVLAPDGSVVARAAVPFEREPGETIAAVAVPQPDMETAADAPQSGSEPAGIAAADPSVPGADTAGEMPAAPDAPEDDAVQSAQDENQTPGAQQDTAGAAADAPDTSQDATTSGEDQPMDMAAAGPQDAPSDAADAAGTEAPPTQDGDVITAAPPAEAQGEAEIAAAPDADLAGEGEFTAPKLQSVDSAVIIRRGDTLWRISRRVYGRGIRYSTIYLANQDQIEDPDRIWPGQVFSVPEETEQGETADMEAIGEQAVPADTESRIIR